MHMQTLYDDQYGILSLVSARTLAMVLEADYPLENLLLEEELDSISLEQWYHLS